MITTTKRWLRKNRTNFAVGFGVVGAGYLAGQYVISKISEARERMVSERVAKDNLRRRFRQNQDDCTITVLELLPTITGNIVEALPCERITQELQQKKVERLGRSSATSDIAQSEISLNLSSATDEDGKSFSSESYVHASQLASSRASGEEPKPTRTKAQLWNELKICSITRAFTLIYTVSLLSLFTRVQLNLLGRRSYLASVVAQASYSPQKHTINLEDHDGGSRSRSEGEDFELNRKYLTFSWWLLHEGWRELMSLVEHVVAEVFGSIKPTENISLETLSSLILDVRRGVEGLTAEQRSSHKWLTYLLPQRDDESRVLRDSGVLGDSATRTVSLGSSLKPSLPLSVEPDIALSHSLRRLLDETADIIESPLFNNVLTLLLDASFSQLTDHKLRAEAYKLGPLTGEGAPQLQDVSTNPSSKLATVLAVLTREAHKIGHGLPNDYVQALESVTDLEAFAAVVYSSNFEMKSDFDVAEQFPIRTTKDQSTPEHYESPQQTAEFSLLGQAAGFAGTAWSGFESVWAKVAG